MTQKALNKLKSKRDDKFAADLMGNDITVLYEITSENLFKSLDYSGKGSILKKDIIDALESRGILMNDPRIAETYQKLKKFKDTEPITPKQFHDLIVSNITLIELLIKSVSNL